MASHSSTIYITFLEKEGPYIKLWGQTDRGLPIAIEKALQQMTPQFEQGMFQPGVENFQVGLLCCAKFKDGSYYRARITNISYLQQGMVEVLFIDYGNRDVVSCVNMRTIAHLSASLISIPAQARDFILANVSLHGWNFQQYFDMICQELRYLEFQMIPLGEIGPYLIISLYLNKQDITINLLRQNLVTPVPIQIQQMTLQSFIENNSPDLPVQQPIVPITMAVQPKPALPQPPVSISPPMILNYKVMPLDYECEHKVYISYVSDGPCLFSVQLKRMEEPLKRLMTELNSIELQGLEENPLPGTVCLAQSTEDGYICRAVVTSMVDGKYKVFYVDFGNTELLPFDKLFQIPFKYVIPKVMATRFALAGVEQSTVSIEMKCSFKEFVNNKLLNMRVIPTQTRSAVPQCELWDESGIRAIDVVKQVALQSYPNPVPPSRGFSQEVKVSFVYSCNRFYVQLKSKEQELSTLMDNLQKISITRPNLDLNHIREGVPCYALFSGDGIWYRAQMLGASGEGFKVRYVDYGNEELVAIDCLKQPQPEQILALRPQAIECCLNGYQNMEPDEQRDSLLEELILEQDFSMKVVEIQGSKALVDLFDSAHYNVASLLLDKIASATSQVSPLLVQDNHRIEHRKRSSPEVNYVRDRDKKSTSGNDKNQDDKADNWRQNKFSRNTDDWNKSNSFDKRDIFQRTISRNSLESQDSRRGDGFSRNDDQRNKSNSYDKREFSRTTSRNDDDQWGGSETSYNKRDAFQKSRNYEERDKPNFEKRDSYQHRGNRNDDQRDKPYFDKRNDRNQDFQNPRRDNYQSRNSNSDQGGGDGFKPRRNDFKKDGGSEKSWSDGSEKGSRKQRNFDKPKTKFMSNSIGDTWRNNATPLDLASDSAKFKIIDNIIGSTENVEISWFYNPINFYCQIQKYKDLFKPMMEEIQKAYKGRKTIKAVAGAPVIASFPVDGALYRAEVLSVQFNKFEVRYVDYGNRATVNNVYAIETKYMDLPAQALSCGLEGIGPVNDDWPDPEIFAKYFEKEAFSCKFISDMNGRFYVDLTHGDTNVGALLIEESLAVSLQSDVALDLSLLVGQQMVIVLQNVASLNEMIIQLEPQLPVAAKLHNLEAATKTSQDSLMQWIGHFLVMYVDNVVEDRLEVTFYDLTGQKLQIIEPDEGAFESVDPLCAFPIYTKTLQGYVSHAAMNTLFIQPSRYVDMIAQLLESLYQHYESVSLEDPLQPEVGVVYAVHSTDTNWYRGRVTEIIEGSVNVTYVDYGNSELLPITELRELSPLFYQPHMLAVEIQVSGECESLVEQEVTVSLSYGENGLEGEILSPLSIAIDESQVISNNVVEQTENVQCLVETENVQCLSETENEQCEVSQEAAQVTKINEIGVLVALSHVDSPGEFYLQLLDAAESINNLHHNLQEQIHTFPDLENPTAGILCAAPYSVNQEWYRAQILDADDDITTVRFVDFGNTDVINNATTSVKTLPPDLLALEQHARLCSLYAKPVGSEWSIEAFDKFEEYASVELLSAEILHQDEKLTYVELYCNGKSLTEMLKNDGVAGDLELKTETSSTGFISNLNSPSEFWIQLENSVPDLEWVAEQLSMAESYPSLEDLAPGALCAAIFPGDDSWYRARILSNTVAGLEVIFIDYGNSCSCTSLRELPEDLIMLPALAHKCSLQKPLGILQWSSHSTEKFKEISGDGATIFNVNILTPGETSIVQLTLDGSDISHQLLPETKDCVISQIDSIDSFWVQMSEDTEKLEMMAEEMEQAEAWPVLTEVEENDLVGALYEDELWYRARVLNKVDDGYQILFVDYGNITISNNIRKLSEMCENEMPMAVNCKLDVLPRTKWADDAEQKFSELSSEGNTIFQMESVTDNTVRLYLNGSDIRLLIGTIKHTPAGSLQNTPKKTCNLPPLEVSDIVSLESAVDKKEENVPREEKTELEIESSKTIEEHIDPEISDTIERNDVLEEIDQQYDLEAGDQENETEVLDIEGETKNIDVNEIEVKAELPNSSEIVEQNSDLSKIVADLCVSEEIKSNSELPEIIQQNTDLETCIIQQNSEETTEIIEPAAEFKTPTAQPNKTETMQQSLNVEILDGNKECMTLSEKFDTGNDSSNVAEEIQELVGRNREKDTSTIFEKDELNINSEIIKENTQLNTSENIAMTISSGIVEKGCETDADAIRPNSASEVDAFECSNESLTHENIKDNSELNIPFTIEQQPDSKIIHTTTQNTELETIDEGESIFSKTTELDNVTLIGNHNDSQTLASNELKMAEIVDKIGTVNTSETIEPHSKFESSAEIGQNDNVKIIEQLNSERIIQEAPANKEESSKIKTKSVCTKETEIESEFADEKSKNTFGTQDDDRENMEIKPSKIETKSVCMKQTEIESELADEKSKNAFDTQEIDRENMEVKSDAIESQAPEKIKFGETQSENCETPKADDTE